MLTDGRLQVDAFGACDAMSTRRQKVDDMDVSASSDLWNEPVCDRPKSSNKTLAAIFGNLALMP
jgi:hypothetical protein